MKAVLKYPGAKNRIAKWIVDNIPTHKVYCEPFLAVAQYFLAKSRVTTKY